MKPLYEHDCDNCEFVGTLFKTYDIYICKKNKADDHSCIARYGNDGCEYASIPIDLDFEINKLQSKIGGIKRSEAIVVIMMSKMPSLITNNMTFADDYDFKIKIINDISKMFGSIEDDPGVMEKYCVDNFTDSVMALSGVVIDMATLINSIEKYDIETIPHHKCAICGRMTSFRIVRSNNSCDVYFDGACNCVGNAAMRASSFDVILDFINNNKDWRDRLAAMICCGIVPFSTPEN